MRSFVPRSPAKGTGWATGCSQVGLLEPVIPVGDACRDAVIACGRANSLCVSRYNDTVLYPLVLRREQPPLFAPFSRTCLACPGRALHEKGLQRQIGVGTLVSSQERRAPAVPLINRLATAGQPLVNRGSTADFVPPSVYIGFRFVRASEETFRTVFSIRWRARGRVVSGPDRPNGVPSYPAPPRPAAPPCSAPTRPARGVSGFWIRQVRELRNLVLAGGTIY